MRHADRLVIVVAAAALALVGLAGCSKQKASSTSISPSTTAYEIDLSERDRVSLAIEFATRYWSNATADTSANAEKNYSLTWDWNTKCLAYCEPGSSVYEDFRTRRAGGAGSPGFVASTIACAVTKDEGNVVSLAVDVAEHTDSSDEKWAKTANRIYAVDVTYDENNLVTGFSYHRTDASDGTVTSY